MEEELFQYELATEGRVSGCGGFGTLLPFVFGVIIGGPLSLLRVPGGETLVEAAGAWILLGQLNLYRRVNEFYPDDEPPPASRGAFRARDRRRLRRPLHAWWALLPPPLDVVLGGQDAGVDEEAVEEGREVQARRRRPVALVRDGDRARPRDPRATPTAVAEQVEHGEKERAPVSYTHLTLPTKA